MVVPAAAAVARGSEPETVLVALAATAEASSGLRPAAIAAAMAVWEAAAAADELALAEGVERFRLEMVLPEVGP